MQATLTSMAIILVLTGSALAAPPVKAVSVMLIDGKCERLEVMGRDMTEFCQSHVANVDYSDKRVTFTYSAGKDFTITFSGFGPQQIHRGPDSVVQPIDTFYTSLVGQPSKPEKVVGSCEFANPYNGKVEINCTAESSTGRLVAQFTSNGQEPMSLPLR